MVIQMICEETMFEIIKDATVLVKHKLGYKELAVYKREDSLYAKNGQFYIALLSSGVTSNSSYNWVEIEGVTYRNVKGKLLV